MAFLNPTTAVKPLNPFVVTKAQQDAARVAAANLGNQNADAISTAWGTGAAAQTQQDMTNAARTDAAAFGGTNHDAISAAFGADANARGATGSTPSAPTAAAPAAPAAPAPVAPPTPGLLSAPGAYEEWLKANQGRLDAPTNVENLYNSGAANLTNNIGNVTPVQSGSYQAWLAGGGASGPSAGASASMLGSAPNAGNSSGVLGSLYGPSGGPSAGSSAGVLGSLPTGPSNASQVYQDASGQLAAPGSFQQKFNADGDAFDAPGAYETAFAGGNPFDAAGAYETAYDQYGDSFNAPNQYEDFYSQYGGDPMQKSYTETLYEGGLGQLDPYYDYAEKRALDTAQNRSAARGGFNSGLAAQQESDITGNLRGQQAQSWVDLAPVADSAKRARYEQGSGFAKTASDQYSQRIRDLFDTAEGEDDAFNTRNLNRFGIAKGQDDAYTQRILAAFGLADTNQQREEGRFDTLSTIAGRGDAADTARSNTRVTAAGNADDASIGAFSAEWNARNAADQNRVSAAGNADRTAADIYSTQGTIAGNADRTSVDAYRATQDANLSGERLSLDQWLANAGLANQQDSNNRANTTTNFNLAGQADDASFGRLSAQGGMARDLQSTGQNRVLGGLGATGAQGDREAKAASIYNDLQQVYSLDTIALQAMADKYGIKLQQTQDEAAQRNELIALLIKAADVVI